MDKIATGAAIDRRDLFSESASRLGMNPAIVEKDFWVCWILKHLFAEPALKGQMVFKGGTSLSKVFGLIDRFSEDIDLILDWRLLGYGHAEGNDPYQTIQSKTKRSRYNLEMNAKAAEYIRGTLLGQLNRLFALVPGIAASIDENDPHTVNVRYPAAFTASYIRPEVRLDRLRPGFHPMLGRFNPMRPPPFRIGLRGCSHRRRTNLLGEGNHPSSRGPSAGNNSSPIFAPLLRPVQTGGKPGQGGGTF
jgi:hypothetical protein